MLIAMVMVPIVALIDLNGIDTFKQVAEMKPTNMNLFKGTTVLGIISLFAWDWVISDNLILLLDLCL